MEIKNNGKNSPDRKSGPVLTPSQRRPARGRGCLGQLIFSAAAVGAVGIVVNGLSHIKDDHPKPVIPPQPSHPEEPATPSEPEITVVDPYHLTTEFYTTRLDANLLNKNGTRTALVEAGSCVSPFRSSLQHVSPGFIQVTAFTRGGTAYDGYIPDTVLIPAPEIKGETACKASVLELN